METTKVTKEDVKAIRKAERVCFDYNDGQGDIRIIGEVKTPSGKVEWSHKIYTDTIFEIYEKNHDQYNDKPAHCFEMDYIYSFEVMPAQTFLESIREGDVITLKWYACDGLQYDGNNYLGGAYTTTTVCDNAKVYNDKLLAFVTHENGKKQAFFIKSSYCPNNSARMIQWHKW